MFCWFVLFNCVIHADLIKAITMKDNKGDTALHLAVRKNQVDLAKQLVGLDANL